MGKKKTDGGNDGLATSFPKKWKTKLPEGFEEKAEAFSSDDLKKKVVEWEQQISASEKDLEADEVLAGLKEQVKEQAEVYKLSMSMHQAMIRFAIYLLESRGAA